MKRILPLMLIMAAFLLTPAVQINSIAQAAFQCQVVVMIDQPQYEADSPTLGDAWTLTLTLATSQMIPSTSIVTPLSDNNWTFVPQSFPHVAFNESVEQGAYVELQAYATVQKELENEAVRGGYIDSFQADCGATPTSHRFDVEIVVSDIDSVAGRSLTETWTIEAWVAVLPTS